MFKFFILLLLLLFMVFVRSQHPSVTEKQYIYYPILQHVFLSGMFCLCHVEK